MAEESKIESRAHYAPEPARGGCSSGCYVTDLMMVRLLRQSERPPSMLSSLNFAWSSADMRLSLSTTPSRHSIVDCMFSSTMSNCISRTTTDKCQQPSMLRQQLLGNWQTQHRRLNVHQHYVQLQQSHNNRHMWTVSQSWLLTQQLLGDSQNKCSKALRELHQCSNWICDF